jgi:hypothetical protein
MTTPETMKSARFSAYLSLLRALYVLYKQGMHTYHISCVETGDHQPTTKHEHHNHTHELIFTTTFSLCTHLQTNIPHTSRKEVLEARKRLQSQTSSGTLHSALFFFLSLRWITNNNNLHHFGNPRTGKRGVSGVLL